MPTTGHMGNVQVLGTPVYYGIWNKGVKDILKSMDINPESFNRCTIEKKIRVMELVPYGMENRIKDTVNWLNDLLGNIQEIQSGLKPD